MRTNLSPQLPHLDWNVFGDGFRASMIPDPTPLDERGELDGRNDPGEGVAREDFRATA